MRSGRKFILDSESGQGPRAVARAIMKGRRWLLASHVNPDGDAIGAMVGLGLILEQAGQETLLYNHSGVPRLYQFLPGVERIQREVKSLNGVDGLIILDSGAAERIGPLHDRLAEFKTVINLDHHLPSEPWGDPFWVDPEFAAVGTMVLQLARFLPAKVTPEAAQNLYVALMTDTGSFKHSNTTSASLSAAAFLSELGADPGLLARKVYQTYSLGRLKLMARVIGSLEISEEGRLGFLSVGQADFAETGTSPSDMDSFVDLARGVEGVEVAATLREEKDGYKISLRSKGRVNVAELASEFGGGGHKNAAGAFILGTKDRTKELITAAFRDRDKRGTDD